MTSRIFFLLLIGTLFSCVQEKNHEAFLVENYSALLDENIRYNEMMWRIITLEAPNSITQLNSKKERFNSILDSARLNGSNDYSNSFDRILDRYCDIWDRSKLDFTNDFKPFVEPKDSLEYFFSLQHLRLFQLYELHDNVNYCAQPVSFCDTVLAYKFPNNTISLIPSIDSYSTLFYSVNIEKLEVNGKVVSLENTPKGQLHIEIPLYKDSNKIESYNVEGTFEVIDTERNYKSKSYPFKGKSF